MMLRSHLPCQHTHSRVACTPSAISPPPASLLKPVTLSCTRPRTIITSSLTSSSTHAQNTGLLSPCCSHASIKTRHYLLPSPPSLPTHRQHSSSALICCAKRKGSASSNSKGSNEESSEIITYSIGEQRVVGRSKPSSVQEYRLGGQSSFKLPFLKTVEDCLQQVQGIRGSSSAKEAAETLYKMAKLVDGDKKKGRRGDSEVLARKDEIGQATATLATQLLKGSVEELTAKDIGLTAWSLGVLVDLESRVRSREVKLLVDKLAVHAVSSGVMERKMDKACMDWAQLLYGIAEVGITCEESAAVQQLFTVALTQRMPALLLGKYECEPQSAALCLYASVDAGYSGSLEPFVSALADEMMRVMKDANAQNWSNVVWACAKYEERDAGRLGKGMRVLLQEGAAVLAGMASSGNVVSQDASNTLWAMARFGYFDGVVSELAFALAKQAGNAKSQEVSNTLWSLSKLGWYDASVYSTLLSALVQKGSFAEPQDFSNALLSCAEARHWDCSVEGLAVLISNQSEQQWEKWDEQALTNSLYAWAVLTAAGPLAASASRAFSGMAQQLFRQVLKRGSTSSFIDLAMCQLYVSYQVAAYVKLPVSLSTDATLVARVENGREANLKSLQKRGLTGLEKQVVAALQRAGHEVKVTEIIEKDGFKNVVPVLVQGVAVRVMDVSDYFHGPPDLLSGSKFIHSVLDGWMCDGCVIISEAEWVSMQGDEQKQQVYVTQHIQRLVGGKKKV